MSTKVHCDSCEKECDWSATPCEMCDCDLCLSCRTEIDGKTYCNECAEEITEKEPDGE